MLLIGVVDLYISFDKRFSEIPLSPIRPEGADALRLWYAEEITLSPTRPEGAEAHSPGQRPGLFGAVICRPVRAKALKLLAIYKAVALTGRIAHCL